MAKCLSGLRILLVEDEPLLALDLELALEKAGATVVGPASTVRAGGTLARQGGIGAAILDVRLGHDEVGPVAEVLHEQGIPFVFHTGHGVAPMIADIWPSAPVVHKPADPDALIEIIAALLHRCGGGTGEGGRRSSLNPA